MITLSIDSATPVAAVAIVRDGVLLAETMRNTGNTHSEKLMPMVISVLEDTGLTMAQVDVVAVSQGPGSFTGLRIGMATAKGLVQGSGCRLVAVPTLDCLAQNLWGYSGLICPMLNAKKNEVYTALYRWEGGEMRKLTADLALAPEALIRELAAGQEAVWFLGDGVPVYGELLKAALGQRAQLAPLHLRLPVGAVLAELGEKNAKQGKFDDLFLCQPVYVRKSEAEVRWEAQHPGETIA